MRRTITIVTIVAALTVSACGTRLNPFNWFGRSQPAEVTETDTNPLIPRRGALSRPDPVYFGQPIGTVREVRVERLPGGAILRATGIADRQGPYQVQLTRQAERDSKGTIVYSFDVILPAGSPAGGTEASRTVVVGVFLTDRDLEGVRAIRVEGARNAQVTRRR